MGQTSPLVSVVLPVFNEEPNLAEIDSEIRQALSDLPGRCEILYVDDGSTDGSFELLSGFATRQDARVRTRAVRLRRNYGQTAALAAGFDAADGEVIVSLDSDGQNDPADIPELLRRLEDGFDVVSGWRRARQDRTLTRRLPSQVANRLVSWVSGLPLHDYGCTLKAYRASLLKEVRLYGEMHRFLPVYLHRIGGRVAEIEVNHRPRKHGASKYGSRRIFKVLLDLSLIHFMSRYFTRPMHFFGQAALWFGFLASVVVFLMFVFKFGWLRFVGIDYRASFVQTPLPALAASLFVGSVLSLFIGIQGEISIRVLHESQGLRPYAIETVMDSEEV